MASSVQFRPQKRDLGTVMREVDKNLAIFLRLRNDEKQRSDHHLLVDEMSELDSSTSSSGYETSAKTMSDSLFSKASQPKALQIPADDNFLNLNVERFDHDWLLTQTDSTLSPIEVAVQEYVANQSEISKGVDISPKYEQLESKGKQSAPVDNSLLQPATPTSIDSSTAARKKPASSGTRKPTPRLSTPTSRPTLPAKSKTSPKPTVAQPRSSTPDRPSLPVISKSGPRSSTPTPKPAADRSSSGKKIESTLLKNPVASRGPSKPSKMLSWSHDAMENPKTSMPKRPASASRARPSGPAAHLSSPAKVHSANNAAQKTGRMVMVSRSRGHSDDVLNPVLIGSKMVERVVNMRKLAPPAQDGQLSHDNNMRKLFRGNSGFGRSLSRKSLDMALRHMDISRSIPDNI